MKNKILLNCTKCSHDWIQRGKKKPKVCSCCKSKKWDQRSAKDMIKLIIE